MVASHAFGPCSLVRPRALFAFELCCRALGPWLPRTPSGLVVVRVGIAGTLGVCLCRGRALIVCSTMLTPPLERHSGFPIGWADETAQLVIQGLRAIDTPGARIRASVDIGARTCVASAGRINIFGERARVASADVGARTASVERINILGARTQVASVEWRPNV